MRRNGKYSFPSHEVILLSRFPQEFYTVQLVKLCPRPSRLKWGKRLKGIFEFQQDKQELPQAGLLFEASKERLLLAPRGSHIFGNRPSSWASRTNTDLYS